MNGKMERITSASCNAFVSVGSMCAAALEAQAHLMGKGIESAVYNIRSVKPLDPDELGNELAACSRIITLEDGTAQGGVGMRIASILQESKSSAIVKNIGWPDRFIPHGTISELKARYGLSADAIASAAEEFFEKQT
jgi:1-deoxy-D-xylulose-5-phosphate synthase